MGVEAGEQGRARWAATRHVVGLRKTDAVGGERIDIGRANFAAVAADVRNTKVIGENNDDVGTLWWLRRRELQRYAEAKSNRQGNVSQALFHRRRHLMRDPIP